jgi:glucans biosynthesis protein C
MERLAQGYTGSFWEFYPSIFEGVPYPKGNTSWHHLWFIAYLFVYDLVAAPLFAWMISDKGKKFAQRLNWFGKSTRIYLLIVPSIVLYASLVLKYPATNDLIHDYAFLPYWFLFLLIGFLCVVTPSLMDSLERNRRTSITIGLILFIMMNYLRWNSKEPWDVPGQNWRELPATYAYLAMYPAIAWFWVMALTGYGKKYLNKTTSFSNYASQAVYPFYVVHQTIIVILAFYVVQANDSILMKYLFLSLVSLFLSVAVCHLIIQRFSATRFLFGLKPARKLSTNHKNLRSKTLISTNFRTPNETLV